MVSCAYLRRQAALCLRIAAAVDDQSVVAALMVMADDFSSKADEVDPSLDSKSLDPKSLETKCLDPKSLDPKHLDPSRHRDPAGLGSRSLDTRAPSEMRQAATVGSYAHSRG
jgi:hypothetical protein